MQAREAVRARRTVRAYGQEPVAAPVLAEVMEAARSALDPEFASRLSLIMVDQPQLGEAIFECLKWAAYTAPRGVPGPGAHPCAYLVVLRAKEADPAGEIFHQVGATLGRAMLSAVGHGLGSCWIKSINHPRVAKLVEAPAEMVADSVLALGHPAEFPQWVDLTPQQEGLEVIRYWRDEKDRHFVPKRALDSVLHWQSWGGRRD